MDTDWCFCGSRIANEGDLYCCPDCRSIDCSAPSLIRRSSVASSLASGPPSANTSPLLGPQISSTPASLPIPTFSLEFQNRCSKSPGYNHNPHITPYIKTPLTYFSLGALSPADPSRLDIPLPPPAWPPAPALDNHKQSLAPVT